MRARPQPKDSYEQKLLSRIDQFGWSITSVADPENRQPSFSYSIGIFETFKQPEVLVIGQRPQLGCVMINLYGNRLKRGETFTSNHRYAGFIEGFDIFLIEVDAAASSQTYTRSARWLYSGTDFPLRQMVWPDTQGNFPWDDVWPESFDQQQPILGAPPGSKLI